MDEEVEVVFVLEIVLEIFGAKGQTYCKRIEIVLEMNVSSVAHTPEVWATEETFISNTISTYQHCH